MTQFSSNCTLPESTVNWVSQPNTRGTWDILQSALTTLFLCTWTVQHPNLPESFIEKSSKSGIKSELVKLLKRLALMLLTLITPEFLLLKALGDYSSSKALEKELKWRAQRDRAKWGWEHSYLVDMGGFVIAFTEETRETKEVSEEGTSGVAEVQKKTDPKASLDELEVPFGNSHAIDGQEASDAIEPSPSSQPPANAKESTLSHHEKAKVDEENLAIPLQTIEVGREKQLSRLKLTPHQKQLLSLVVVREKHLPKSDDRNTVLVQSALAAMKEKILSGAYDDLNFIIINSMAINLVRLRTATWALDGSQFIYARENGLIASIPDISADEINDKRKSDSLAKFLACVTVGWQIIKLLMRWAKQLPASQLEVVTVAYSLLTFIIYIVNWNKPQDVEIPYVLTAMRYPTVEELLELADKGPGYTGGFFSGFTYAMPEHAMHTILNHDGVMEGGALGWAGGIAGGLIFGALHCAAWNFAFPTPIESLLWKITSLLTTCIPVIFGLRAALLPVLETSESRSRWPFIEALVIPVVGWCVVSLYIFSRGFLLVETFRSLLFLVPETFES